MTVKLSISVPDDVAASLRSCGNVSQAVIEAVRQVLPEARRADQRAAAQAYGEFLRGRASDEAGADRDLIESSNDIALRHCAW